MSSPPKSSLVERLVQDRLRSGELDSSAARLLQVGEGQIVTPPPATGFESLQRPPAAPLAGEDVTPSPAARFTRPAALEVRPLTEPAPASILTTPAATPAPAPLAAPAIIRAEPESPAADGVPDFKAPDPLASVLPDGRPDLGQGPPAIDSVALERGGMVDWSRTRSRISEEFRLVQRQILRSAFGPGAEPGYSNLLMVTSARPGEGKSFTSLNLAGSIARQGDHHVLLVDADSKRDSFCYALGLAEMRGLLDLVANPKLDPSPLIVKTPIERLSILPVGRERERSAELFSTKEMTRLIQSLGRRYADRLLLLDAPPCLSTSDPAVLAPVVGQILFVVEADRTQRDEVEASLDLIQACPNISLVLNKQQISSRYTFGAYSSYYSS
jgi:protein-tyrosine kinase